MSNRIISSFSVFSQAFPHLRIDKSNDARVIALQKYFSSGGVVSVKANGTKWPSLVYPHVSRLESQIEAAMSLKNKFEQEKGRWEKKLFGENFYHIKNNILKLSEPVYWKHLAKLVTSKDYNFDASQVSLPAHLVCDKRWKPMIKMFVENIEYRKQLVETVQQGIVYKDNKRVGKYANDLRDFRIGVSSKKVGLLKEKIESLDGQIKALQEIMQWAKEKHQ